MTQHDFFTARPRLAAYLFDRGHEGRTTTNPYKPSLTAWVFVRTDSLDEDVRAYFASQEGGEADV